MKNILFLILSLFFISCVKKNTEKDLLINILLSNSNKEYKDDRISYKEELKRLSEEQPKRYKDVYTQYKTIEAMYIKITSKMSDIKKKELLKIVKEFQTLIINSGVDNPYFVCLSNTIIDKVLFKKILEYDLNRNIKKAAEKIYFNLLPFKNCWGNELY